MNRFELIGARLTRDPEIKYTPTQTAICNLIVAIDTGYGEKKETDFPRVTVYGKTAESLATYSAKGLRVNVFGRIKTERRSIPQTSSQTASSSWTSRRRESK